MNDQTVTRLDDAGPRAEGGAQIVVVEGPARGAVVDLGDREVRIGRRPDNDLVLGTPAVSKYHARIVREGSRFQVEDLKSTNGLSVNGVKLEPGGRRVLYHGDNLVLGDHLLLFRQAGSFTDKKTGMSTISFDRTKVKAEVDDLLKDLPDFRRPS